eukprot:4523538-Prymnesium_polylepis.1
MSSWRQRGVVTFPEVDSLRRQSNRCSMERPMNTGEATGELVGGRKVRTSHKQHARVTRAVTGTRLYQPCNRRLVGDIVPGEKPSAPASETITGESPDLAAGGAKHLTRAWSTNVALIVAPKPQRQTRMSAPVGAKLWPATSTGAPPPSPPERGSMDETVGCVAVS